MKKSCEEIILGINFCGHDTAIFAILPNKKKIFGMATERLTRYKHDSLFPVPAIYRFLDYENIDHKKVGKIVVCQMSLGMRDMLLDKDRFERECALRKHSQAYYKKEIEDFRKRYSKLRIVPKFINSLKTPSGMSIFFANLRSRLGATKKTTGDKLIRKHIKKIFPNAEIDLRYYDHEYCHLVCALVTSDFERATLVACDGWGDGNFSKVAVFDDEKIVEVASSAASIDIKVGKEKRIIYSIGGIYSYFTEMLGFSSQADEGKVEALAAYGEPIAHLLQDMIDATTINKDNSIVLNSEVLKSSLNQKAFEGYLQKYKKEDLAATVQVFLERVFPPYIKGVLRETGLPNVAFAGGVTANVICNMRIFEGISDNIHVTPAMADDGAAQGAACAYLLEHGWNVSDIRKLLGEMPYYGSAYSRDEVKDTLENFDKEKITFMDLGDGWPEQVAQLVVDGKIGAIFHGRMEWGPRALGNRSIIADPRRKDFRDIINRHIKRRPKFQPFCPSMLLEEKDRLFERAYLNKHMTCAFRLKDEFRDIIPSAAHIDGTARVQFVEAKDNHNYYRVLKKVQELTGFGVVINTSFNKHGRTIVESPTDALTDFLDTDMDYVVIEGFLVERKNKKFEL
ncbi:MAG: carbamoyltransferase C-terminal domain-containing protein [bacterium]|nr:carbamoyltransferase C-terminal domain-containing protein [bacterium]